MEHFITHKIQAKVKNLLDIIYLELSLLIDVKKSHFVHDFDPFNFCPPHNTLCLCIEGISGRRKLRHETNSTWCSTGNSQAKVNPRSLVAVLYIHLNPPHAGKQALNLSCRPLFSTLERSQKMVRQTHRQIIEWGRPPPSPTQQHPSSKRMMMMQWREKKRFLYLLAFKRCLDLLLTDLSRVYHRPCSNESANKQKRAILSGQLAKFVQLFLFFSLSCCRFDLFFATKPFVLLLDPSHSKTGPRRPLCTTPATAQSASAM